MRWKATWETEEQKYRRIKALGWHTWFAWHPVKLRDGSGEWAWLEYVQRRIRPGNSYDPGYTSITVDCEYRGHHKTGAWTRGNCAPIIDEEERDGHHS